ncbi:MAG: T9SS type A sorting domain-containing protein [Candidatus Krumholzibacteria bacterium]|jgi:hypothetical protein|nr:T9SS type A sorting domain-containing protein [Candidatus Krumholzibacteria bacterium]
MRCVRIFAYIMLALLLGSSPTAANWLGNVRYAHPSHSFLPNGEYTQFTWDYKISEAAGARFQVTPMAGGATVAGHSWSGSAVYPAGTGTTTSWFAFWSDAHYVDHVRIEMKSADWSTVLLQMDLPVTYRYSDHGVFGLQPSHTSPSWLRYGQHFSIGFSAVIGGGATAWVVARPFTNGALTPGYTASGMTSIAGTGSGTQWFTFGSGDRHVDQIRFQVWNVGQTELLLEFFVPVDLTWGAHGLSNFVISAPSPEHLAHGQNVTVEFDYATSASGGVYIWAYPAHAPGQAMAGHSGAASPLLTDAEGHLSRWFNFPADEHDVPYIWIRIAEPGTFITLFSVNLPVAYHWGEHGLRNFVCDIVPPAVLDAEERVYVTCEYTTTEAGGVRIFLLPYTDGHSSPDYAVSGSPLYPTGTGTATNYFRISSGQVTVDQVRYRMTTADQSATLLEIFRDHGPFFYGGPGFATPAGESPPRLAVLEAPYPNPFNPTATVPLTLSAEQHVRLAVFDLRGRLVRTLVDGQLPAGRHEIALPARDLASGTYLCVLTVRGERQVKRLALVR